mgnify:CR=1 FL=1
MKMIKFLFILFLTFKICYSQYYINYEHQDHCKYLHNDMIWLEKQIHNHNHNHNHNDYEYNYEFVRKELDQLRKEVSQMWHQLCKNEL